MDKSLKIRKVRERVGDEQQYKEYKVLKMKISINMHNNYVLVTHKTYQILISLNVGLLDGPGKVKRQCEAILCGQQLEQTFESLPLFI